MLKYFCFISLLSLSFTLQVGSVFPSIIGESLDGKSISIPEKTKGKKTLVGMAYSQKAEADLTTWYQPMYDKFIAKVGMFDSFYDVNVYFIAMFTGANQAAYEPALKKLRSDPNKELFPYIVFYKGDEEPYVGALNMKDKNSPYFFVLDENGKILYATSGSFSEKKMEDIEAVLE